MGGSRRITWLVFIVGVIAVVDVLAWVSWRLVSFEREQQESREEAARQEAIGRALWRMDSIVIPLLAVESARPYWEYKAFYPANRPADQMWMTPEPGDVLVPSPLLGEPGDLVRLHFERDAEGRLSSPQAPTGEDRDAAVDAGVPELLLSMAEFRLYELDRLERDAQQRVVADERSIDALMTESVTSLEAGQLAAPTTRAELASAEAGESGSGLRDWMGRAAGESVEAEAADVPAGVPPAAAAPGIDASGGGAPRRSLDPALQESQRSGMPTQSEGPEVLRNEGADLRQDYEARQQAVNNAQNLNDAGRVNRQRGFEQSRTYGEPVPPAPAPETATATREVLGAGSAANEAPSTQAAAPSAAPGAASEDAPRGAAGEAVRSQPPAPQPASERMELDGARDRESNELERVLHVDPPAGLDGPAADGVFSQLASGREPAVMIDGAMLTLEAGAAAAVRPAAGPLTPVWRGSGAPGAEAALLLVRRITVADQTREQGVWIDWPTLRRNLEASVSDLFPLAQVQPLTDATRAGATEAQRLATIPVVLLPGPLAAGIMPPAPGFWTPTRWTLLVGWIAVLIAVVAIGVVLRKAIDLGERRGRFVSAVTHELRTPLTTFRLYSQMLAGGISDEAKRTRYAQTLDRESQRLSGIVESVLEYARLGRSAGASPPRQRVEVESLLERIRPALSGRAERAGMELVMPEAGAGAGLAVSGDADKLERILLNLVDNACKYAADGAMRRIEMDVAGVDGRVVIGVRDYGPGVPPAERRRIFRPFHRAKMHDASANPGLGLGLALSRGLAREMGGELCLCEDVSPGARFELRLPAA